MDIENKLIQINKNLIKNKNRVIDINKKFIEINKTLIV